MTEKEAIAWLRQVQGELYRAPRKSGKEDAWVAVVRSPGPRVEGCLGGFGVARGRIIIAIGETLLEAAEAAEGQWSRIWRDQSALH